MCMEYGRSYRILPLAQVAALLSEKWNLSSSGSKKKEEILHHNT